MKSWIACALMSAACATARAGDGANDLVMKGMGEALVGRPEKALEIFTAAKDLDPANMSAQIGIGTSHIQLKHYRVAYDILRPLLDEEPNSVVLMNNVAWIHVTADDPELFNPAEGERLASAALALAPADCHVWSTLSEALYVQGHYEESLRAAEKTLKYGQQDVNAAASLKAYQEQIEKCKVASQALTLVE